MTFPPHIQFSRIALLHIADPLFGVLALWFLIRAIRSNRRLDWVLMGVSLGMTQYFFEAGRLFTGALILAWAALVLVWFGGRALWHRLRPVAVPLPRCRGRGWWWVCSLSCWCRCRCTTPPSARRGI
jgi:4-amino-4-deoxy-L-arabinose transferase-like glycosyltransferase